MFLTRDSSSDKASTKQFKPVIMTAANRQHTAALRTGREGGRLVPELLRLETRREELTILDKVQMSTYKVTGRLRIQPTPRVDIP